MVNLLIVIVLLTGFAWWELLLLLAMIFLPRKMVGHAFHVFEDKAIGLIFGMFHTYRGFTVDLSSCIKDPLPPRYLVVSNHQSLLDIPILMRVLPKGDRARFVAKHELAWGIPLISLLLRSSGHSLVRRKGDMLQAMRAIARMARRCRREGTIPVIFPEGTRSRTGELGVFHSAGYRKLLEADQLPILVTAVEGGWNTATLKHFFSSFGKEPYSVSFLKLLPAPSNKREALASLDEARRLIGDYLEKARESGSRSVDCLDT